MTSKNQIKHEENYISKKQMAVNRARFPILYEKAKIGEADESEIKILKMFGAFFYYHKKARVYDFKSLYLLPGDSKVRKAIVWFVESPFFDTFILAAILGNSLALAMYNYDDRDAETKWNQGLELAGLVFSIIFIIECVLKILAMGFFIHFQSYLRDGWNIIDFLVVLTGLVEFIGGGVNLKALRALRVLRPLRSINAVPSMRRQV